MMKKLLAAMFLLCMLLIGSALAEEPVCTITFDKDSYKAGETVKAHYKIDFDGRFKEMYACWEVITDWEDGDSQWTSDNDQALTKSEGDVYFTPQYGEGIILRLSLTEDTGEWHNLRSEPVRVTGFDNSKPNCIITFSKDVYNAGEAVKAHYKIDFARKYTELHASWEVITDWEDGDSQWSSDNDQPLKKLEGDAIFIPKYGEGLVLRISLTEDSGNWFEFKSDPVRVIGFDNSKPKYTITYDKDAYIRGETVKAHYKIDFNRAYADLHASWKIITDWEDGDSQWSSDNDQLLKKLEGDVVFTPKYGEGVAMEISLTEVTGNWHTLKGDPVRIYVSGTTILPKYLKAIKAGAFEGAKFGEVVCPNGLVSIGSRAFADCVSMASITIPASVTSIAEDAFAGCTSLTTIVAESGSVAAQFAYDHDYEISYL